MSQIFEGGVESPKLVSSFAVRANNTNVPVIKELDYTDYPVSSLRAAEKFYTDILMLGKPCKDSAYRGHWSNNSVFGIYMSKLKRDGLPRPHKTNGYISFWINSAKETHAYLQKQGSTFPKIPAINSPLESTDNRATYRSLPPTLKVTPCFSQNIRGIKVSTL